MKNLPTFEEFVNEWVKGPNEKFTDETIDLNEAILKEPDIKKAAELQKNGDEKGAEKILKQYSIYLSQFNKIVRYLTDKSGYWYIGSAQQDLQKKIQSLSPEELLSLRTEIASFVKKSNSAEKIMLDIQNDARDLIKKIEDIDKANEELNEGDLKIDEYTDDSFTMPTYNKSLDSDVKDKLEEIVPNALKTMKASEKKLKDFVGNTMFTHVGYNIWKDEGLKLHWNQYWINDTQEKWQGKKSPGVSLLMINLDGETIASILVDTDTLLQKDVKKLVKDLGKPKRAF